MDELSDGPNDVPIQFQFPKTVRHEDWEDYLKRPLTRKEMMLIEDLKSEHRMNLHMDKLYKVCRGKKMYVPLLTNMNGDCLFESLNYHKIGYDVESLRKGIAFLLYIFQNYENFFPNNDMTLKDQFALFNEVEYVYKIETHTREKKYFKYTYSAVCQDISSQYSWSKLPTQMILNFISYLYKVNIVIISDDTGYEINANAYEHVENPPPLKNIYLGHLGELHYVPIDSLKDNE